MTFRAPGTGTPIQVLTKERTQKPLWEINIDTDVEKYNEAQQVRLKNTVKILIGLCVILISALSTRFADQFFFCKLYRG